MWIKVLFLDIDWVLIRFWDTPQIRQSRADKYWDFKWWLVSDFDIDLVDNLNKIIFETNCYLIISSSWRHDIERIEKAFNKALDYNRIIWRTPDWLWYGRWNEILTYINDYNRCCNDWYHIQNWVAIDDDSFDMKCISRLWKFVHTKTNEWLTEEKAQEAILILNKQ